VSDELSPIEIEVLRVVRDRDEFRFDISQHDCSQALFSLWVNHFIDMEWQGDEDGSLEPVGITSKGILFLEAINVEFV
jgi:hypothetical protein